MSRHERLCENCDFYDSSTQNRDAQPDTTGLCRKSAPRAKKITGVAFWPFVEDTDWCGEFWPSEAVKPGPTDDDNVSGAVK